MSEQMTWGVWLGIWAVSFAFTGIVAGLAFLIGFWTFVVIFPLMIVGLGFVVTR